MKTVALVAKPGKPEAVALAKKMKAAHKKVKFIADAWLAGQLGWEILASAKVGAKADLVVVLGGDGTLIQAARLLQGRAVPIMGINLGSLGFMTEFPLSDAMAALGAVLKGQFLTQSRMKLSCRLYRDDKLLVDDEVLNDVVINKSALAKIADHETWLDSNFVALFKSDGIICSTPSGSTAYSLSAGGPIVHPSIDCVVLTPICPHALTQRPIVVPGDQTVRIVLKNEVSDVYLTIDGQTGLPLKMGDRVEVRRSKNRVLLVSNPGLDYFAILRQKLRWGER
ncbi:MAG: NAD(+)/NADH kinase [Myxococcaceae bacterium]|nr:NAD(+)/NADH kinase [Myxococcaceae bacterium]